MLIIKFTLAQIEAFQTIVRTGNFRSAAKALGLTQPSISQRIRELEKALGTTLFIRQGPRIELTADGHALSPHADHLIGSARGLQQRFQQRDPLAGILRLGVTESFAALCLSALLTRLERHHPALSTSVQIGDTSRISALLNAGELDLAVVSEPEIEDHIESLPIGRNGFGWIARADYALLDRVLLPAELAEHHLILTQPSSRLHRTVTEWFAQQGAAPSRVSTCNSIDVTMRLVHDGTAIAVAEAPGREPDGVEWASLGRGRAADSVPPGHHLCHQLAELGEGLRDLVALTQELVSELRAFVLRFDAPSASTCPMADDRLTDDIHFTVSSSFLRSSSLVHAILDPAHPPESLGRGSEFQDRMDQIIMVGELG
ncbi:MAG: LysR family transcriptional regulator [Alphaproteobacteria bacterium]